MLEQVQKFIQKKKAAYPELKSEIDDCYTLMLTEIDTGENPESEISKFYNEIENLIYAYDYEDEEF